jgi:hypothetical protein
MRRLLSLVVLATALSACGSDSSTQPTQASVAGTWNLTSVNGVALPWLAQAADPKVEVLNDQLVLSANGTFTQSQNVRFTDATQVVTTQAFNDAGTYSLNGASATFRFNSDGSSGTGTISGNTLTVGETGFSFVYTKQ